MAKLTLIEKHKLEKLFGMHTGYVLDFSNASMAAFFLDAIGIDIEDRDRYGDASKANRMRAFWQLEPDYQVGKLLDALLDYREFQPGGEPEEDTKLAEDCRAIAKRLMSGGPIEVAGTRVLEDLSHEFITEHAEKCRKKMVEDDHSGAISSARALVETVLLALERELFDEVEDHKGELSRLYKRVAGKLKLDAGQPGLSDPLRQVLSGLTSVVNGLASVRNKAGDAHGKLYRTREHHARVAVDAASTLTNFLLSTYEYQRCASVD